MTDLPEAKFIDIAAGQERVSRIFASSTTAVDATKTEAFNSQGAQSERIPISDAQTAANLTGANKPARKRRSDAGTHKPKKAEAVAVAQPKGISEEDARNLACTLVELGDYPAAKMVLDAIR